MIRFIDITLLTEFRKTLPNTFIRHPLCMLIDTVTDTVLTSCNDEQIFSSLEEVPEFLREYVPVGFFNHPYNTIELENKYDKVGI